MQNGFKLSAVLFRIDFLISVFTQAYRTFSSFERNEKNILNKLVMNLKIENFSTVSVSETFKLEYYLCHLSKTISYGNSVSKNL